MFSVPVKRTESDSGHCFHCTDENSNPRLLRCFHSFCLGCLESLGQHSHSTGVVHCPDCLEQTALNETLDLLPKSSIFGKMILDINKILRQSTTEEEPCAGCPTEGDGCAPYNHPVSSYCLDCQEFFCHACAYNHTHFRFAASHSLITGNAEEVRKPRDLMRGTSRFCKVHVEETEKLYCRQCDECFCELCYSENHDRCKEVEPIDEVKAEMEEFVWKTIDDLRKRIYLGTEFLRRLEREERQLIRRANQVEDELENGSCIAKELVARSADDFLHKLEDKVSERYDICDSVTRAANRQVEDLETFRTTMARCLEKASPAHLVSINSGRRLQKVEREAKDFSESWQTMLLTFEESKELEELLGEESIWEVLGRLEETDSDDGYLEEEDDNSGPELCDGYGVRRDPENEKVDIYRTAEVNCDVEVDNSRVEVGSEDTKTEDEKNIEDRENKEEIADTEAALWNDDVVDKTENGEETEEWKQLEILYSRTTDEKNEMSREESESILDRLTKLVAMELNQVAEGSDSLVVTNSGTKPRGKKMRAHYEGKTKLFTVPNDEADEEYEFTMEHYDTVPQIIDRRNIDENEAAVDTVVNGSLPRGTNGNATWSEDSVPEISFTVLEDHGPGLQETTFEGQRAAFSSSRSNGGAFSGLQDFRFTSHPSVGGVDSIVRQPAPSDMSTASEPKMSFLWNQIDQGRRGEQPPPAILRTSLVSTSTPLERMNQSKAEQVTTGSSRFSMNGPPITMRENWSEQNSTRTPFPVTSGHPITMRQNVSEPDTSNYPITMRKNGAGHNSTRIPFPDIRSHPIQNWSRPETVEPEVLFYHEADTYRGTQRVGSGVIKVLIGKEDNENTSEIYFEWDEEFEHLTPDSRFEPLTLDPETYTIQVSSHGQLGREASAVEFANGAEAEKFENTLEQLIGQMDSLRLTNKATAF